MSKRRKIGKRIAKAKEPQPQYGGVMYKTTRGVWIECLPVQLLYETMTANIAASIEWPSVPERTTEGAGGVEVTEDITQEYIDGGYATDDEKAEWVCYQDEFEAAKASFESRIAESAAKFLAVEGIRLADESLLDEWRERDEFLDMEIPDDQREQMAHFLQTRILGNGQIDGHEIMLRIFRASGYDEEVLDTIERTFRSSMGGRDGDTIGRSARDDESPAGDDKKHDLVGEQELHVDESEEGGGTDVGSVAGDDAASAQSGDSISSGEDDD